MANALSAEIKTLLDRPNFAHLATLMPDGSPQSAPVWVTREGDRILVTTGDGSLMADPYSEAQLRGRVIEWRPDREFVAADAAAGKYTGQPFPWRDPDGRVALVIEVDKARYTKLPFTHRPLR